MLPTDSSIDQSPSSHLDRTSQAIECFLPSLIPGKRRLGSVNTAGSQLKEDRQVLGAWLSDRVDQFPCSSPVEGVSSAPSSSSNDG